ncbi:hypothetical protein ACN4C3_26025, partial [Enterobacter cloacae complex sp.6722794]
SDIMKNIDHLEELSHGALWLSSLDLPVRLLVLPEGALQGFNDEALDLPIAEFLKDGAIDIPGPETDRSVYSTHLTLPTTLLQCRSRWSA